ncbi:GntR family transcriptional regulator [Pseudoroseomonas cervicalis]|uniref:Transcriptional regulator, GntR family n=1 Tax=Pseudoroseomonas cervicalis ATCC 49957 TaxID=525371 RepID=D5RJU9_9PROT|nr:GntR family transcriptional regulator [Pseudoroseomonas cervicalis]EFH12412.1 transcriptional regulator, GntR family [Pseudoroseomonas cervicalis ATCC 49957]WBV44972.1 GntR family transcriptional regulator [Pseudoroseomonas cervicalis]
MMQVALERREPIARELYAALRQRILTGELVPGTAIAEAPMAEQLGVSRTPVREVFRRLSDEGLLEVRPQIGSFVAPIQLDAVHDSQFVRETLECRTVRMAAEQAQDGDIAALRAEIERQRPAVQGGDALGFFASDESFHAALIRMAGRPAIWRVIQDVKTQLDRVRYLSTESQAWLEMIFSEHERIAESVAARDADAAEAVMRQHLRTVFAAIEKLRETRPEYFAPAR